MEGCAENQTHRFEPDALTQCEARPRGISLQRLEIPDEISAICGRRMGGSRADAVRRGLPALPAIGRIPH